MMTRSFAELLAAAVFATAAAVACATEESAPRDTAGAGGASAPAAPQTCQTDPECDPDFCDLGLCVARQGVYGASCKPAPRGPDGKIDGKLNACAAYLCKEGRCRSCESDIECQENYGAPRCTTSPGRPGKRCGA